MKKVYVEKFGLGKKFPLPKYETEFSSGIDLRAAIKKDITLRCKSNVLIPTGIRIELPNDIEAQIRPRSGLALKYGITVLNSPGTIDSDYRGEICVILINHYKKNYIIKPGHRIAQLIFVPIIRPVFIEKTLNILSTKRNTKGFGSTGIDDKND